MGIPTSKRDLHGKIRNSAVGLHRVSLYGLRRTKVFSAATTRPTIPIGRATAYVSPSTSMACTIAVSGMVHVACRPTSSLAGGWPAVPSSLTCAYASPSCPASTSWSRCRAPYRHACPSDARCPRRHQHRGEPESCQYDNHRHPSHVHHCFLSWRAVLGSSCFVSHTFPEAM